MKQKTQPGSSAETSRASSILETLLNQAPDTLPILRQSCIQVLNLTADQRSNASDVGEVIMRDQALMANIIKIANSPAYHTLTSVKTPTHAVAIIGFDIIRSIVVAAQLVEQAEEYGANTECLKRLLARSLVAATEAVELGKAIHYPDMGFLFTNAMLYTLGDLILAFCRPDLAEKLETERVRNPDRIGKIEIELLGRPLRSIASSVAKRWRLPDNLIQLLERKPISPKHRYENSQKIMEGLVYTANELSHCLLSPQTSERENKYRELTSTHLPALGLTYHTFEGLTIKAFTKANQFSDVVKIDQSYFLPKGSTSSSGNASSLHELTKAILEAVTPENQTSKPSSLESSTPSQTSAPSERSRRIETATSAQEPSTHPPADLNDFIQHFALQALQIQDPNALLNSAAEGLYTSGGFDRVVLMLVVPATGKLEARITYGHDVESMTHLFRCSVKDNHLLTHILRQYQPMNLDSFEPHVESGHLSQEFIEKWGNGPCFVGPLFSPANPIGVLLVDRGHSGSPLTTNEFASFALVLSQVNANLARLAQ